MCSTFSRRRMQSGSAISRSDVHAPVDEKLAQFHRELTETCTDMMARYTFGNFSALPHRSHMAEFLLAGGQSQTWLLGNKLVTITTSGSGNKAANLDVCEKCQAMYQQHIDQREPKSGRRRHRSAVVFSRSTSCVDDSRCSSQDDITLMSRTSQDDTTLGLDLTGQDVAVQTGASLNKQPGLFESEPLESLILGIKGVDLANFNMEVCNCWCTNWAEIYIRAPSGNLSWMMRIENEASISNMAENQVPDITMLFASMGKKRQRDTVARHSHRIESGSIGEEEYETLYKQHFETRKQESHLIGIDLPQIQETSTYERPGSLSLDGTSLMEVSTNSLGFVPSTTTCLPADTEQDGHQTKDEKAIMSNQYGCVRYMRFIQSLGSLLRLRDCDPKQVYLGGLDTQGSDGEFAYRWQDESTQMIFHIATLMPNKESDVNCNQKKAHIGNDYVTVVYNDSGEEYKIGVIKGQFNYVNIVIKPLDYDSNAITLQAKEVPFQDQVTTDIAGILGHTDTKIISDGNLATLVRQIAIHSNLASMVLNRQAMQPNDPYANNWLERLRKIRRLRANLDHRPSEDSPTRTLDDFTQFV
ncbi:hypothetical protein DPMN_025440 [Dreissena polymorpha]|uniref:Rap-GAP domain-containing protein n=1 Tax=Dreissena polymorpha TaxID=45954 RepID=A0A9D4LRJ5_DREPO|nr:hypothetical protein DPMN_025440 [Dreissena polymorpha]